ncbi:gamma-glutamyltransferase [Arenicella xantha]|uniref:Glutathione hydrolase proenzyme n=1 Tax=Arenicella xantha TaxID=644221 RepID=A0A395JS10_9GAMM|nr:gamma-glutamyltransferase [Arenicella xantha]RBP53365.1 gamma-glutamyltransferase 1 [Arenicella xantha]
MLRLHFFCISLIALALSACVSQPVDRQQTQAAAYAMPDKYSAQVVEAVLREGGNAIDAAVAAGFTLAVTFPEAGNIGGGGFLLTRFEGQNYFLDYREKAPLAAHRDMYLDATGEVVDRASLVGIRAAGVPGTVDGLWRAHQRFGRLPWQRLLEPAIQLAEQGFDVHPQTAGEVKDAIEWFDGQVNFAEHFGAMQQAGKFVQPELAKVLQRIAQHGPADFYSGETARMIVAQSVRDGGLITEQDLIGYQSVWREPLVANWREFEVVTAPPPSSGGFAVIQLLKMKALLDPEFDKLSLNSPQYVHLIAEMEKRVFADRAQYFGDPDFVDVPIKQLISDAYIEARASEVQLDTISQLESVVPGLEPPSTTHYSIMDQWGNAVSNTYTINWSYGSGVVVEGAGFLLNNEMDDFSIKPGVANVYGVVGGSANEIQPAKRMLSSMSPTILLDDTGVRVVVGTPGGSTIFTSVFQGIVNVIDNDMSATDAVSASRFHHQLLPPELVTTSIRFPLPESTRTELIERGYRVEPHAWEFGDVQLIHHRLGDTDAASDPRGIGVSGVIE